MGDIIKVNFNNARIKLPTLIPPEVSWIDNKTVLVTHNNSNMFDEVRMLIYVNNEFKIDTYEDRIEYRFRDDFIATNHYEIRVEFYAKVSLLNRVYNVVKTIYNLIVCSEQIVCSNSLTCQD